MKKKRKKKDNKNHVKTNGTKIEMVLQDILEDVNVNYKREAVIGKYTVDFLVGTKIIECFGGYWHCDPRYYAADYFNKALKMTAEERWEKDYKRKIVLESMGYEILYIWETDLKKAKKEVINKIKQFLT